MNGYVSGQRTREQYTATVLAATQAGEQPKGVSLGEALRIAEQSPAGAMIECSECEGSGDCGNCDGQGCDTCEGSGDCTNCNGDGEVEA